MKNHLRGFAGACFPAFFANWFSTAKPLVDYKRYHRPKQFTQAEYMISFVIIFISITSFRGSQRLLLGCDDRDACGSERYPELALRHRSFIKFLLLFGNEISRSHVRSARIWCLYGDFIKEHKLPSPLGAAERVGDLFHSSQSSPA